MSKDYPFPLWVNDFFKDTDHLNREEKTSYLLLLMHMWKHGGSLANHDPTLARLVELSPRQWAKVKPQLIPLLQRYGEPGSYRLTQNRLLKELAYVVRVSESQSQRGKMSVLRRNERKQQLNFNHGLNHGLNS